MGSKDRQKNTLNSEKPHDTADSAAVGPTDYPIDKKRALELVRGDMDLFKEMVEIFFKDCPIHMTNIKNAVTENDSEALNRDAHALKGVLSVLAANQAFEIAFKLEKIGESGDLSEAEDFFKEFEGAIENLTLVLKQIVSS